jgi:hypothetical protein
MYEETNNPNSKMIECDCFDREHIIYIDLDHEDRDITFTKKYISYVFKCEPEYMWDSTILSDPNKIKKLQSMCQVIIDADDQYQAKIAERKAKKILK